MDSALGWLGDLARWLAAWVPRLLIVRATHGGVAFVHGRRVRVLRPGLRVYWPLVTEVDTCPVVRQVLNLPTQTLMTADGHAVVASGIVVYSVADVEAFLARNFDGDQAVADLALAALRKVVVSQALAQLQAGRRSVDGLLTREARRVLGDLGCDVEAVRLTDFAQARVLSLVGMAATQQRAAAEIQA